MDSTQTKLNFSLNIKGNLIQLDSPTIMGIINLTPDSFFDGGVNYHIDIILNKVESMLRSGVGIIDIGAMSSRPYSKEISEQEELDRLANVLPSIHNKFPDAILSIDTYRSKIAEYAIQNGASIINDITAGRKDENILFIAKKYQIPYIAMHMQGNPTNMQNQIDYNNILSDILYFFSERMSVYNKVGLSDIIIDVGFGFGKTIEDNYRLLKNLSYFNTLQRPILVGISRKSMIYKPLHILPQSALNGTTALHFEALRNGANILRVHDVIEAIEVKRLFQLYRSII